MKDLLNTYLTTLVEDETAAETNEWDGLEYQIKNEFYPTAMEKFYHEIAEVIMKHRKSIYRRKHMFEDLTGRRIRVWVPRQVVKIPKEILERYEDAMGA